MLRPSFVRSSPAFRLNSPDPFRFWPKGRCVEDLSLLPLHSLTRAHPFGVHIPLMAAYSRRTPVDIPPPIEMV